MDLGVLLESPQGRQSSSPLGACRYDFLPSCSGSVTIPFAWIKGSVAFPIGFPTRLSHEAFPRGFPTGLSHVPPLCESILGLKVEAVQGKHGLRHLGDSGMVARPWSSSRLSCGEHLLRCDGNAGNSFPTTQGKDHSFELGGGNGAPLDVGDTLVLHFEWRLVCCGTS